MISLHGSRTPHSVWGISLPQSCIAVKDANAVVTWFPEVARRAGGYLGAPVAKRSEMGGNENKKRGANDSCGKWVERELVCGRLSIMYYGIE